MADVINDMIDAEFVIAEITPTNPNVYYELGFAHAIGKPVQQRSVFPRAARGIRFEGVLFERLAVVSGPGRTTKPPRAGARGVSRRS
jgi:nucleoside 2-deoxyribosyltransferase